LVGINVSSLSEDIRILVSRLSRTATQQFFQDYFLMDLTALVISSSIIL